MSESVKHSIYFEQQLLDREKRKIEVNIKQTPYFYNDAGRPTYLSTLPKGLNSLEVDKFKIMKCKGREYNVSKELGTKVNSKYGLEIQLEFDGIQFEYEPMWATRKNAAAFGITLVKQGQAIKIESHVAMLSQIEYEYGMFAGHWCPYLDSGRSVGEGKTLFPFVCTDLEHHDFPHIFASTDRELPLVVSVARYWPKLGKIYLADLWIPMGQALYIPSKPRLHGQEFIDLHNNRNAAQACWGQLDKNTLSTHTMLQTENTYFYWYWNKHPTIHRQLMNR
ncbi:hypothetical protein [Acinetobacter sp. ANC 4648]|uniref:hypothetical protein n=1 Tax=Acinetobacter sp. ANC 4648 TaxID=1977875 RepID=UPI000A35B336|nr:hypothetical protein [Acinetobacter sp. ANC 4648]OTG81071.1 hypothetical protein B9T27_11460 [Acinetobacter sp. ANC 4648]